MHQVCTGCGEHARASQRGSPALLARRVLCVRCLMPFLPPSLQWLKDPGPRNEKRTLFCDMVCFLFITPLAAISGWLCLRGAQDHLQFNSRLEAIGLIALTIALFTIYVLWTLVSVCCPGPCFCSKGGQKPWLSPHPCSQLFLTPLVRKPRALSLECPFNYLQMGAAKVVAEKEKSLPDHLLARMTGSRVPGVSGTRAQTSPSVAGAGGRQRSGCCACFFKKKHKLGTWVL